MAFSLTISYNWSVPDEFNASFSWTVVNPPPPPVVPTIVTGGLQNTINRPTLIYPNGGENIFSREIEISWKEASPVASDNLTVWYELYFTENYEYINEPDWKMIAVVPSGTSKYLWKIGNSIKSKNVRVGIRAVNSRGQRSTLSLSADSFSIRKSLPFTPAVVAPVPNQRYGTSIQFIFDDSAILNSFAQRAKYYIYFSSIKANIPYTVVAQKIPVGVGSLVWDTSLLPPSDDYVVTVYLADDDGNKSDEVVINNLSIIQEGFFLIDTKAPSGYMQINNSDQYTKDRNVSVRLYSYDETTDIHAMQFIENDQSAVVGSPESFANLKFWQLTENDGVKTLGIKIQDYGANRISQTIKTFRILFELNNDDIADIAIQNGAKTIVWLAKNGTHPEIHKFDPHGSFVANVNENINTITIYGDTLYIGVQTSDNTALIYRWTGFVIEEVLSFSGNDSEVISMHSYKNKLFFGCKNGDLYVYDGLSSSLVKSFGVPIQKLYSDNSLLYIIFRNSKNVSIYDGSNFSEITV